MSIPWKDIIEEIKFKRLLILGEIHGASVNPSIIVDFVKRLGISVVMIELELKWQKELNSLLSDQNDRFMAAFKQEKWLVQSGLIGRGHIEFFRKYVKQGGRIVTIKVEDRKWNKAEKLTAGYIKKFINKNPKEKVLLVMGNLHTRKKVFSRNSERYISVGSYFKEQGIFVKIRYGQGEIYNFKKIKVKDLQALRQAKKKGNHLAVSRSPYYDYEYIVAKTTPITLL